MQVSSDYSYEQIGDALANKYRLYDGDGNAVATIENVEALQFEDNLTVASALTPLSLSEQDGDEPVEIPTLSMH